MVAEVPILLFVNIRVQCCMHATVGVATLISKPYIIAGTCSYKSWSILSLIDDPPISCAQEAMHEENRRFLHCFIVFTDQSWNAEYSEDVPIFCRHFI